MCKYRIKCGSKLWELHCYELWFQEINSKYKTGLSKKNASYKGSEINSIRNFLNKNQSVWSFPKERTI